MSDVTVHRLAYNGEVATKTERLNLRLTPEQDLVLRAAAEAHGETASEYVLRHAVEAAEIDLADRRVFVADEKTWAQLQVLMSSPASANQAFDDLMARPSVLEPPPS